MTKNKYIKLAIKFTPMIIWMIFIFILSNQSAVKSSSQSSLIVDFIKNASNTGLSESILTLLIRKSAHMFMYFILGILAYVAAKDIKNRTVVISLSLSLLYAIFDEVHQFFVIGRSCELRDVLIDFTASFIGVTIMHLLMTRHRIQTIK